VSLDRYCEKRDFNRTPEPQGRASQGRGNRYVIQKHAASRLHYDLRLECDGVLLSWAVPKGPSLSTARRRLAVRVEDHPLDYADFEGVIPGGEYGGGTVMVWDTGTYETPDGRPLSEALAEGFAEFVIHGAKLRGRWKLIHWPARGPANWLLVKGKDEHADPEIDITKAEPNSALSGRTMAEIAAGGAA